MDSFNMVTGATLGIPAGALSGSGAAPAKKIRNWEWQNTWLIYSFWTLLILPVLFAFITVPGLLRIYASTRPLLLFAVLGNGMIWGLSNVGCGFSIKTLGIALTSTIVIGIGSASGTVIPIAVYEPGMIFKPFGLTVIASVLIVTASLAAYLLACMEKNRDRVLANRGRTLKRYYVIAVLTGVGSAMFNLSLLFGRQIENTAVSFGAARQNAVNASWAITLLGGFISTVIYCAVLIRKRGTARDFRAQGTRINRLLTFLWGYCGLEEWSSTACPWLKFLFTVIRWFQAVPMS